LKKLFRINKSNNLKMLTSMALTSIGLSELKKSNHVFHKNQTRLPKSGKKRSFQELDRGNDHPSKAIHALKDGNGVKVKLTNPNINRLKQMEKNRKLAITTGMHPALKEAKNEIMKLRLNLRKVEEQSIFWRRKTLNLQKELLSSKSNITDLIEQVKNLEKERAVLQDEFNAAEQQSAAISDAMKNLIAENNELKETMGHMDGELNALMKSDADDTEPQVPENANVCIELEKALEDTMADLSDRLAEIEDLKKLLAKVTIEKNLLEKAVSKKQIIAEIVDINLSELEDSTESNKIAKLQEALEKCMFRIAVLTQKNEELTKLNGDVSFSSDHDARLMDVLEDGEKLSVLESVCMQRYRNILKEAVEELVSAETTDNPRSN